MKIKVVVEAAAASVTVTALVATAAAKPMAEIAVLVKSTIRLFNTFQINI